jgi:pyruvate/2-oxoglutarate dehydrogenase complex dihydrolipoamide acyltransferase (E2) component
MNPDSYTCRPFPPGRTFFVDAMDVGGRKHCMHGLIEVDVSISRRRLREIKERDGEALSFTGFIVYCCARAVDQNKPVQAYRDWRNRLIVFDDVDVLVPVERVRGEHFTQAVIRAANRKSVREISQEIREIQHGAQPAGGSQFFKRYAALPGLLRRLFFRVIYSRPELLKQAAGTVMVTSVGMFGEGAGWGVAPVGHALTVTIGGTVRRPVVVQGQVEEREHACITVTLDHAVVDGAPAARFIAQLKELLARGSGLFEA